MQSVEQGSSGCRICGANDQTIPKDALRLSAMPFNSQRFLPHQPFAHYVRPTKSQRQQRQQFLQSFWVGNLSLFQTKPATLQTPKQRLNLPTSRVVGYGRITNMRGSYNQVLASAQPHPADIKLNAQQPANTIKRCPLTGPEMLEQAASGHRPPTPICDLRIGSHAGTGINLFRLQISEPGLTNKLSICAEIGDRSRAKQEIKLFEQIDAFLGRGASLLLKYSPRQRDCYALVNDAKCHHVKRRVAQLPIRSIRGDGPGGRQPDQFDYKESYLSVADLKEPRKSLHSFIVRSSLSAPGESTCYLNKIDGLNLDQRNQELSQEVDARFVPSYIIGKRSLQEADVGHCGVSFQDSFGDDLDKNSGMMAFYAFSKISFCPVPSRYC
jgi:hypothetical protein